MEPGSNVSFGPYKLISRLGAGGMGEVWKAEDTRLGRIVAIKVLPKSLADDPESRARLQREARTAAHLYHPNIATIHSIEQDGDRIFIVMQFVDGEPLSKVIERGMLSEAEVNRIGKGAADALAEAHLHGVVHRDMKPDNIMVSAGQVKVLDFGIAKQVGTEALNADGPTAFMTKQGMIIGTVQYMSPEQALGRPLDFRTDIFSLGVVLYQALTGKLPFRGETITETLTQIIRDEPIPTAQANPAISPGLAAIVDRCLRKKKEDRYGSASELAAALDQQFGKAPTAPASSPAGAASVPQNDQATVREPAAGSQLAATQQTASTEQPGPRRRALTPLVIAALIAILAIALWLYSRRSPIEPSRTRPAVDAQMERSGATMTVSPTSPSPPVVSDMKPSPAVSNARSDTSVSSNPPPLASVPTASVQASEVRKHTPPSIARTEDTHPVSALPATIDAVAAPGRDGRRSRTDDLYNSALAMLARGRLPAARRSLEAVIANDPHYAPAHLRLGEVMLLAQDSGGAAHEFNLTLDDRDRLTPSDQSLAAIGAAIAAHDMQTARRLAKDFSREHPDDPELRALRRAMGEELREERGQSPRRGLGNRRRRPE